MRNLIHAILGIVAALFVYGAPVAQAQQPSTGVYTTYIGEQLLGTESYALSVGPDGSLKSEAELSVGTNKVKATTVATRERPVSFLLEQGGVRVLAAEFDGTKVKLNVPGQDVREVKTQAALVMENLVWHHCIFLLARYDAGRAGQQNLRAFLPSQATEYGLQIERVDTPVYNVKGRQVATEHYRVLTSANLLIEIWADAARVPLLLRVPSQNIKVIQQGAEDLGARVFQSAPKQAAATNESYTNEEVTFSNGDVKLAATLTVPKGGKGPFPAAVIISGSGAQDRDGTVIFSLYKLVAERLSANGVAVLRADDRYAGLSDKPSRPPTYRDLVNDSRAAFDYLAARPDIDPKRIALVGHSEGAQTAGIIAAEDSRVAAVALLAGASRTLERVALEQSLYTVAMQETLDASDTMKLPAITRGILKYFDEARTTPPPAATEPDKLAYFREHMASDPLATIKRVRCPVLILNGERDQNVLPYHALELAQALVQAGNKEVRLRIFPNLTHLYTPSALDPTITGEKVTQVSEEFLRTLQTWMTGVLAGVK